MRPSPSVAVVIPVYNGASHLAETLESVLSQTLTATEILIIDDGSSDNSMEIAARYEPRVRIIARQNSGISHSRNFGATQVSTPWITFLDQDDLLEPNSLERRSEALLADPDADVCYADRTLLFVVKDCESFVQGPVVAVPEPSVLGSELRRRCLFNPGSATIRRAKFLEIGGFDPSLDGVEDWDLWIRLLRSDAKFIHVAEPLQQYRVHRNSATQNAPRILERSLLLLERSVLPSMSRWQRWTEGRRTRSRLYAEAAIVARQAAQPLAYRVMLRSIAMDPFFYSRRYLIFFHMLFFGLVPRRRSAQQQDSSFAQ